MARHTRIRGEALFVWPRGGNSGDDLIRDGCIRFLRDQGLDPVVSDGAVESAALEGDRDALRAALGSFTGLIVFSGGGNLGIYDENRIVRERVIHAAGDARGVLVMPQSGPRAEAALRDPRVTVWARDAVTAGMLESRGFRTRCVMDAALNMADTIPYVPGDPRHAFLIRRGEGRCQERLPLWDVGITDRGDPTFERTITETAGILGPFGTVLSDRLHGALIALMMGKRTGILPVAYHKNSAFHATWLADLPGVRHLDTEEETAAFLDSDDRVPAIDWRERFAAVAEPAMAEFLRGLRRGPTAWIRRAVSRGRPKPMVMAVGMVKNEQDVIEPFVRVHAPLVDALVVLDNGSVDRTREILTALTREYPNLVVGDCDEFAYRQSERMTAFVSQLQGIYRADFILLLDADEFLVVDRDRLETLLAGIPVGGVGLLPWVTHVVAPGDEAAQAAQAADPPRSLCHRRAEERPARHKAVIRADGDPVLELAIAQGNHYVDRGGEPAQVVLDQPLRHFPVRSRGQVAAKAVVGWAAYLARDPEARRDAAGHQWMEVSDLVMTRGIEALPLSGISMGYDQTEGSDGGSVVEDPVRWDYVRRLSDGAPGDPLEVIGRSWGQALRPDRESGPPGQWRAGPVIHVSVTNDRSAVRFVVDRFGASEAVFPDGDPGWSLRDGPAGPSTGGAPSGAGCVVFLWGVDPRDTDAIRRSPDAAGDVRAVVVVPSDAESGGVPFDATGRWPDRLRVDVAASLGLRALAVSDVLRRGGIVLVPG